MFECALDTLCLQCLADVNRVFIKMFTEQDDSGTSCFSVSLRLEHYALVKIQTVLIGVVGHRDRPEMSFLTDGGLPSRSIVLLRVNQVAVYGNT